MGKVRALLLTCCLMVFGMGASYSDSLTEYFTIPGSAPGTTVTAEGQVTFTLNANGTFSATVGAGDSVALYAG